MSSSAESIIGSIQEPDLDLFEHISSLEKEWRENLRISLPTTESEWLNIFPEAKSIIPEKIKEWNLVALHSRGEVRETLQIIEIKCSDSASKSFWKAVLKYTHPAVKELAFAQKRIKSLHLIQPSSGNRGARKWHKVLAMAKERGMVEIAASYGIKLRKFGKTYQALCPLHAEHTPSFTIYPPSRFICFGCGVKGSVIDFIMAKENCSFKDAVYKMQNI